MIDTYSVLLSTLVKDFNLQIVHASSDYESIKLTVEDVGRPGLQLAGFYDHFEPTRLQVMGNAEISFVHKFMPDERERIFDRLFSYHFPALLISRNVLPGEGCIAMAKKHDVTLLVSELPTGVLISTITTYLKSAMAPRLTRHGVLVEIYGEGVLLIGDSGIGIINIAKLFGIGAIKQDNEINLVVNIVPWNTHDVYDRLGLEQQYTQILGVDVPLNTIPITPGRNLAMILEVAAMNNRQRRMGYNAALEFTEQINRHFDEQMGNG